MFLWHCLAGHPGWVLPSTLLCGARTFLGRVAPPAAARPTWASATLPEQTCHVNSDAWLAKRDAWLAKRDAWLAKRDAWLAKLTLSIVCGACGPTHNRYRTI